MRGTRFLGPIQLGGCNKDAVDSVIVMLKKERSSTAQPERNMEKNIAVMSCHCPMMRVATIT